MTPEQEDRFHDYGLALWQAESERGYEFTAERMAKWIDRQIAKARAEAVQEFAAEAERRVRAEPRQIVDRVRLKVDPAAQVAFTRAANIIRELRTEGSESDER